jgi:tRNA U34 5-carboxymethylaminomethyl modifying enzyme MnmG/GidA
MQKAIEAYRSITATAEFRTLERMRADARHNEAAALGNARREGYSEAAEKWQAVVADKDAAYAASIADKDADNEQLRAQIASLWAKLGEEK